MKELSYIFILIILMNCTSKDEDRLLNKPKSLTSSSYVYDETLNDNEYLYDGNKIEFVLSENKDQFIEQSIEIKRKKIKYKVRKINNGDYLNHVGFKGNELELAKKDLDKEQVYYFEFEEIAKKNILKTYFESTEVPIKYLSFEIMKDFYLLTESGDTLKALYANYENSSHIAPYERLLMSFPKVDDSENYKFLYKDNLFGTGLMEFSFPNSLELNTITQHTL